MYSSFDWIDHVISFKVLASKLAVIIMNQVDNLLADLFDPCHMKRNKEEK